MLLLLMSPSCSGWLGAQLPTGFLPVEDQGYAYLNVQLPEASSLSEPTRLSSKSRPS